MIYCFCWTLMAHRKYNYTVKATLSDLSPLSWGKSSWHSGLTQYHWGKLKLILVGKSGPGKCTADASADPTLSQTLDALVNPNCTAYVLQSGFHCCDSKRVHTKLPSNGLLLFRGGKSGLALNLDVVIAGRKATQYVETAWRHPAVCHVQLSWQ